MVNDMAVAAEVSPGSAPADVLLTNGDVVTIRGVEPADEAALRGLYQRATPESLRLRFFSASRVAGDRDVDHILRPESEDHEAVVAVARGAILGVAYIERTSVPGTAEFALLVDDHRHSTGIGTLLLEHLVSAARTDGYRRLHAEILAENHRMLNVLRDLGVQTRRSASYGVIEVEFPLDGGSEWQEAVEERETVAEHASVQRLLAPDSVAVVGAGHSKGIGYRILSNIIAGGFAGDLYAVNRDGSAVLGSPAVTTVRDLPATPDLVIIAVPALAVEQVVVDCAAVGVYGVLIVSDGFAELGPSGRQLQASILATARRAGIRIIGPNCLGVVNCTPAISLNATFADAHPVSGSVGMASQSGGVGLALLDYLTRRRIGLSSFVSMGNKADISGNDLLMYWESDEATKACVLYLESFGNARKFARVARRVARTKPIIAVTAGRSVAGARGVRSHTAAAATPDVAIDALFEQAGVIRASTLGELMDIVSVVTEAPLPAGRRVAVISNGGGPGALAADACAAARLVLPELSKRTQRALRSVLPGHAATANPIDTTAGAGATALAESAAVLLRSREVDSVIVVHTSLSSTDTDRVAEALGQLVTDVPDRPLLAVFLGRDDVPSPLRRTEAGSLLPCFGFPESAATALGAVSTYAEWRQAPAPQQPALRGVRPHLARSIVGDFFAEHPDGGWLDTDRAADLISAYGIEVVPTLRATTAEEATQAADGLGYPVVVKSAVGDLLHRTDVGGVKLDLTNPATVEAAVDDVQRACGPHSPVVVQPMVVGLGVETAVGIVNDPTVGPIVMLALGGVATDLLADRSFRLPPLSRSDVRDQIRSLRASPLLFGYRGAPPVDVSSLEDLILKVGRMALEVPEIADLDLNPVVVSADGAVSVDVKVRLANVSAIDPYRRQLAPGGNNH
jgi:acyl-CoA synthetase (NDP forming)/GNAT superfamily N-acetyltransferase